MPPSSIDEAQGVPFVPCLLVSFAYQFLAFLPQLEVQLQALGLTSCFISNLVLTTHKCFDLTLNQQQNEFFYHLPSLRTGLLINKT
jgi:hypothetical protein